MMIKDNVLKMAPGGGLGEGVSALEGAALMSSARRASREATTRPGRRRPTRIRGSQIHTRRWQEAADALDPARRTPTAPARRNGRRTAFWMRRRAAPRAVPCTGYAGRRPGSDCMVLRTRRKCSRRRCAHPLRRRTPPPALAAGLNAGADPTSPAAGDVQAAEDAQCATLEAGRASAVRRPSALRNRLMRSKKAWCWPSSTPSSRPLAIAGGGARLAVEGPRARAAADASATAPCSKRSKSRCASARVSDSHRRCRTKRPPGGRCRRRRTCHKRLGARRTPARAVGAGRLRRGFC